MKYEILKKANILYIEDDKHIAEIISVYLQSFCNTIHHCPNGKDGLNYYKLNASSIDIVITDLNMPKLSGVDVIREIRRLNTDIPIVITSAFGDEEMLKQVINLGVDGFVTKPLLLPDLFHIINKALIPVFYKKELQQKDTLIFQQAKLAAIGEMIGNIAHQWRQPLNSIGVLMMKLELNSEQTTISKDIVLDAVDGTNSIIGYMSKTIDDFRNFFMPNKDKEVFIMQDVVDSLCNLMLPQLNTLNIKLEVTGDKNIKLYGYKNELQQVMINIIGNAKDALKNNDNISDGVIFIDITSHDEIVNINVSDNAGGIPNSIINSIFDPYFTTKFKSQGTGLGLYISKVIIENNMNGKLTVKNIVNNNTLDGAKFTISIEANLHSQ